MEVGQSFYKVNPNDVFSVFSEHRFDIILVLGIKKDASNSTAINVHKFIAKSDDVVDHNFVNTRVDILNLNIDYDEFIDYTPLQKNEAIYNAFGYKVNPFYLYEEYIVLALNELEKKKIELEKLQQKIDEIESNLTTDVIPVHRKTNEFETEAPACWRFDGSTYETLYVTNLIEGSTIYSDPSKTTIVSDRNFSIYKQGEKMYTFHVKNGEVSNLMELSMC